MQATNKRKRLKSEFRRELTKKHDCKQLYTFDQGGGVICFYIGNPETEEAKHIGTWQDGLCWEFES